MVGKEFSFMVVQMYVYWMYPKLLEKALGLWRHFISLSYPSSIFNVISLQKELLLLVENWKVDYSSLFYHDNVINFLKEKASCNIYQECVLFICYVDVLLFILKALILFYFCWCIGWLNLLTFDLWKFYYYSVCK